ncbi:hypothetical protein PINS_up006008 [Pythium insidiosum]|nr:hypothetical protein PINS_up006008 [Pythium insidiosum]
MTLLLQVQVVDLTWCDAATLRRREMPSLSKATVEWSWKMAGHRLWSRQIHASEGDAVLDIREAPAVPVLKQCELQVVVTRTGFFRSHTVLGCATLRLDDIIPDDSLGVFQVTDVKLPLISPSHPTKIIGHLRLHVACSAQQRTAIAA